MKTETMKWLKLELQANNSLSSMYLIFHTHFCMYSYLKEHGFTINIFHPVTSSLNDEAEVVYIQTNHQDFLESCIKNYSHDFIISGLEPDFRPSTNHLPMFGTHDIYQQASGM